MYYGVLTHICLLVWLGVSREDFDGNGALTELATICKQQWQRIVAGQNNFSISRLACNVSERM
jgi:hypothetical protein